MVAIGMKPPLWFPAAGAASGGSRRRGRVVWRPAGVRANFEEWDRCCVRLPASGRAFCFGCWRACGGARRTRSPMAQPGAQAAIPGSERDFKTECRRPHLFPCRPVDADAGGPGDAAPAGGLAQAISAGDDPGRGPCRRARHARIQYRPVGQARHRGTGIPARPGGSGGPHVDHCLWQGAAGGAMRCRIVLVAEPAGGDRHHARRGFGLDGPVFPNRRASLSPPLGGSLGGNHAGGARPARQAPRHFSGDGAFSTVRGAS